MLPAYNIVHALASVVTELAIEIVKAGQDGHDDRTEELSHAWTEGDPGPSNLVSTTGTGRSPKLQRLTRGKPDP
jgi:hypothetical protein